MPQSLALCYCYQLRPCALVPPEETQGLDCIPHSTRHNSSDSLMALCALPRAHTAGFEPTLSMLVQLLTKHLWCHQHNAFFGHVEAAGVLFRVFSDYRVFG